MPSDAPRTTDSQAAAPQNSAWSLQIATVMGIPIRLHFTFLLFLLWIWLAGRSGGTGLSLAYVVTIFACVVLHELGHSVVALHYKIPVADITLYPIGGVARIEKRPPARQELWIALAGPAVNLVIALGLYAALAFPSISAMLEDVTRTGGGTRAFLEKVMALNVWLILFNMIPAFPMDGGRVLRAILALHMPPERATAIATTIGQGIAVVAGIWAVISGQWVLMFIAFFVYVGAGQEAFAYRQAALIEGVLVKQAMMTDVRTLSVGNTLKEAADVLLATSQHDFPVLHGDTVQGILTRNGLLRGLAEQGPGAYVAGTMNRQFATVGPEEDLGENLPRLQDATSPLLVVDPADTGHLLGMVTGDNIAEFFALRQIAAVRSAKPGA